MVNSYNISVMDIKSLKKRTKNKQCLNYLFLKKSYEKTSTHTYSTCTIAIGTFFQLIGCTFK